mmetsp:Transcript_13161/g.28580  ORF Transcript_13161/g.28580 Transcript_13161/m.28580 type:complete len:192 (-) Transcript_13161:610-1185(-)
MPNTLQYPLQRHLHLLLRPLAHQQRRPYLHRHTHTRQWINKRTHPQCTFRRFILRRDLPQLSQERINLPSWRAFSFANSIHRSIREALFFIFMFGSVNCFDLDMARATESRSGALDRPDGSSMDGLENCCISFSSSVEESRNLTWASVHPSEVFSTSPSMTNRRPARSEMSHGSSPLSAMSGVGLSSALSI